jgi:hypothetical protein
MVSYNCALDMTLPSWLPPFPFPGLFLPSRAMSIAAHWGHFG